MSQRKAVLIYNGNAGQKQIDKTLGTVVPILAQSADELLIKPTKHQDDARQYILTGIILMFGRFNQKFVS